MPNNEYRLEIKDYDPQWVTRFRQEAAILRSILGEQVVAIHHIGSTSVPTLPAKPIIDILLEVSDIEALDRFYDQMCEHGYEPRGEFGLPRRRYFPRTEENHRVCHVHAWQSGDTEIQRHLDFRDYLISHPETRKAYSLLKKDLVEKFAGDRMSYVDGKHAFCQETERLAVNWCRTIRDRAIHTDRLTLLPLNPAQLGHYLDRPTQLETALHLQLSRGILADPVPRAIRTKIRNTTAVSLDQILWNTYWLVIIDDESFGAGMIGFKGVPEPDGTVEIGYGIDMDVRRQGYTTEAVQALIGWALAAPRCQAVTARTEKSNIPSIRLLEKLDFSMVRETSDELCWIVAGAPG